MTERPFCASCGGTCFRMWEHFGEEDDSLPICHVTGTYCTGMFCDDYGCAKEHGFNDDEEEL